MKVAIIGAGVGGLSLALSMLDAGINDIEIFESSPSIAELGVGVNILPHAMRELAELGLLDELTDASVVTSELIYYTKRGQQVWREARGLESGYHWPQISIHRGALIQILHQAVIKRLGANRIHTGHRLNEFKQNANGSVTAVFDNTSITVDCLVGCDGLYSTVRNILFPNEGSPKWNGVTMWRGTTICEPFLSGSSMIMAGHSQHRIVCYPISYQADTENKMLINWIAEYKTSDSETISKQDWRHQVNVEEALEHFKDFNFDFLDIPSLIKNAQAIYKYPMVDRDPLASWNFKNITLLGDAAHPMYPVGSNGATQAIIDARVLSLQLVKQSTIEKALEAYDADRRPATSAVVLCNRQIGPEKCMDIVEERSPEGFTILEDIISQIELEDISKSYKKVAGFDPNILNSSPSLSVNAAS